MHIRLVASGGSELTDPFNVHDLKLRICQKEKRERET